MELETVSENVLTKEDIAPKEDNSSFIEIEIPYALYQYLSTENYNVQNICRICLSTNSDVLYSLMPTEENSFLADIFMSLTTVKVAPEDGLPLSICELCQSLAMQYYEFKIKCEKSDFMLRSILKGELVPKDEPQIDSIPLIEKANIDAIDTICDMKDEPACVEVEEYLEDLVEDGNDAGDKLFIVQDTKRNKKKSVKDGFNGSHSIENESVLKKKLTDSIQKTYNCILCPKVFLKVRAYHKHVKNKHGVDNESRPYACDQCKESFASEHDLTVHSALHAKGSVLQCNQCHKKYDTKTTLRRHIQRHMQWKPHSCTWCHKTFTELYALRRHVRVHTGERLEKKYACEICDKRYSESGLLAVHMSGHIGLKPCECATCGKRFPSQRLLTSHMLIHTDNKRYACAYCDKRFRHESTRNTHHRTHTGDKPYVCSSCGKRFIQHSNLTLHMRTHTGERPYACSMCERKFKSGSSLKSHLRTHTGERPYSCKVCGKRFARMNLSAHMRQHTGERPFACSACPKKFLNASRLRDHCRIHTGEKPYLCAYCTSSFATKSHLVKHMKNTHEPSKKKVEKRELVIVQHVPCNTPVIADNIVFKQENGDLISTENATIEQSSIDNNITLDIIQEVPLEVAGELIQQDDSNIKGELIAKIIIN